jgi:hypothetical protein
MDMFAHMTIAAVLLAAGRAVWKAPDWGFKVLALILAIRDARAGDKRGGGATSKTPAAQ